MASFDVVSEIDMQEVRNAIDQASREISQRYDFKNTNASIELGDSNIAMTCISEDRLTALRVVLEEKLVKRRVSLKAVDFGDVEAASGGTVRQSANLQAGISSDKARDLNKFINGLGLKGVQSQTQGEQVRVISKKRDDLQGVSSALKEADLGIPRPFNNLID